MSLVREPGGADHRGGIQPGLAKVLMAGAAGVLAMATAGAAMAQAVVVRSTGPSAAAYPMGRKLPANAAVALRAGDHVTVLDKSGTRVLAGPGNFKLTGAVNRDAASGTALAGMMARTGGVRTRTGAVRGAPMLVPTSASPSSIWYVDVSKGGTYCVADPAQVVLWRPDASSEGTGTLLSADGSMANVTWRMGSSLKLWPSATLPVVDGQTYKFSNTVSQPVKITVKLVTALSDDQVEVAGMLADKGCTAQLDLLANAAGDGSASGG